MTQFEQNHKRGEIYMFSNSQNENQAMCTSVSRGTRLMYLMLGGSIGAAIALLFAPKPGRELRQDIADSAVRSYDESLAAAKRAKDQVVEYYEEAKEKGDDVLNTVAAKAAALKDEVVDDAVKIGEIMQGAAGRVSETLKRDQLN